MLNVHILLAGPRIVLALFMWRQVLTENRAFMTQQAAIEESTFYLCICTLSFSIHFTLQ